MPPVSENRIRSISLILLTIILLALCAMVMYPFLPAITWGIALAILGRPMHRWLLHRFSNRNFSATLATIFIVIIILVPLGFVSYHFAQEAKTMADQLQQKSQTGEIRQQVTEVPVLGRVVAWMEQMGLNVETEARNYLVGKTNDVVNVVQGSLVASIQFLMTVFILFYLFRDRDRFYQSLRDHLPLSRSESDLVATRCAGSVHAGLYATFITSLIGGVTGGIVFWLVGLPAPVLWGSIMFVLSFLPIVGTGLVWVPAAIFLLLAERWMPALAVVTWGTLTFILVDTLLFMRLAGNHMRLHEVPTLLAFLGGIAIFGIAGMVLGPAILALTDALLEVWRKRRGTATEEPGLVDRVEGV